MSERESAPLRTRDVSVADLKSLAAAGHLYCVVDACIVPTAPKKALDLTEQHALSLYRGSAQEKFWEVAPYLMRVDESTFPWVIATSSEEGWGVVIATKVAFDILYRHLRHFLNIQSHSGELWLFRFYDPRVLTFYLPTCTSREIVAFYGPITAYGTLRPNGATFWARPVIQFAGDEAQLWQRLGWSLHPRLRPEQEAEFDKYAEEVFLRETVLYVKEQHAGRVAGLTHEAIEGRVKMALNKARNYGLAREDSILFFLALMFDVAPNFDEQPGIHKALLSGASSADDRMDDLLDNTSDDDWDAAEEGYDESKWDAPKPPESYSLEH